ncbi:hypothetical protein ABBQ38_004034 [Trebouxia sp. C0009 RCD-2024]
MQGASQPNMPQQQQGETMEVLQRLAQLSGANRPESWAQLAAITSVGPTGSAQLPPPMSSGLMGHAPFGNDSAVSQALLQHYWANILQQQQQQGMPRGGSGPLASPDAILSALQAQQQQSQAGGINLPAFQQGLAALLSPNQQQQTSVPQATGASLPSEPLPTSSSAPRQKRALEQLVQAAEIAGEGREARSETSGSCSSPDSKDNGEVKKGSKKRKESRVLPLEAPAVKEGSLLVNEDMMGFDNEEGGSGSRLQVPLYKNAKEKNRQAQRRFRERQKGLINALKDRAHSLDKRVEEQAQTIHALKEENNMLKLLLAEKAYAPQLMQPAQHQQPVLQSSSAQKLPGLDQSSGHQIEATAPDAPKS